MTLQSHYFCQWGRHKRHQAIQYGSCFWTQTNVAHIRQNIFCKGLTVDNRLDESIKLLKNGLMLSLYQLVLPSQSIACSSRIRRMNCDSNHVF